MQLYVVDLLHTSGGSIARNTLAVLPFGKKRQQKVAIGDDSGVLTVFFMKKGAAEVEWRSPPLGRPVSRVALQCGRDKLFVGAGQTIWGFTRKGKEFLKFKTNLTETISSLVVHEAMIWAGGDYLLTIYDSCKDAGFVMSPDRINDLQCAAVAGPQTPLCSIVACQDRHIRVYSGEQLYHQYPVDGPVTALGFLRERVPGSQLPIELLYGTETGRAGLALIDTVDNVMREGCLIEVDEDQPAKRKRRAGVVNIMGADFTGSGEPDVLIGRDDGTVEIWREVLSGSPVLAYEVCLHESIRGLDAGYVTTGDYLEVIVSTYSGRVVALTPDASAADTTGAAAAAASGEVEGGEAQTRPDESPEARAKKVKSLEKEVAALREKLEHARKRYQDLSKSVIAAAVPTKISHRFRLMSDEACYLLTVDSPDPIELVVLRSDVAIDLLDCSEGSTEQTPVVTRSDGDSASPLLATMRCQGDPTRLEVRFRTVEGRYGTMSCFVVPKTSLRVCPLIDIPVKPLSLHERVQELPKDLPLNELRITGSFSLGEVHGWLGACVNDLPARPNQDEECAVFRSTYLGTHMEARYSKGSAVFRTDCVATMRILKEVLSSEATNRKIHLAITTDVQDASLPHVLSLVDRRLSVQHALATQVRLVEPLREIQQQEGTVDFLAPDLRHVIDNADSIKREYEEQPRRLSFLHGLVHDTYVSKWQLKGYPSVSRERLEELTAILNNYNLEVLISFFQEPIR